MGQEMVVYSERYYLEMLQKTPVTYPGVFLIVKENLTMN